ncbi:DUF2594 family protein [Erwinia psidii]|uniref:DUF2594 family protein n=1 Tax=Erwinia psidii TaxID=69224 RepID=A0A3N6SE16_9GAMM|nr:DUF2594 family protein [Erwinia psidii]MCX8957458.1 DUF2594 family protein [Erwinia psidii]MCX8959828.1 DUF2594 family protein [Erwinia psidii]MCX8964771.1 DUF2594 family protein [Erwinia psidii]RQM38123.1 DUF2594 family protein [Erwinia psidii]
MSDTDFSTGNGTQDLSEEIACMKALVTFMLKAMGQADAGKVIINMEHYIAQLTDRHQADVFARTIGQIKQAYRQ